MVSESRVGVFVDTGPVEHGQPMPVCREMTGDPVQQDANALLMQVVDEILKIVR